MKIFSFLIVCSFLWTKNHYLSGIHAATTDDEEPLVVVSSSEDPLDANQEPETNETNNAIDQDNNNINKTSSNSDNVDNTDTNTNNFTNINPAITMKAGPPHPGYYLDLVEINVVTTSNVFGSVMTDMRAVSRRVVEKLRPSTDDNADEKDQKKRNEGDVSVDITTTGLMWTLNLGDGSELEIVCTFDELAPSPANAKQAALVMDRHHRQPDSGLHSLFCPAFDNMIGKTDHFIVDADGAIIEAHAALPAHHHTHRLSGPHRMVRGAHLLQFVPTQPVRVGETWDAHLELIDLGTYSGTTTFVGQDDTDGSYILQSHGVLHQDATQMMRMINDHTFYHGSGGGGPTTTISGGYMVNGVDASLSVEFHWDDHLKIVRWSKTYLSLVLQYNNPYYGVLVTVPIDEEWITSTQVLDNGTPGGEEVDVPEPETPEDEQDKTTTEQDTTTTTEPDTAEEQRTAAALKLPAVPTTTTTTANSFQPTVYMVGFIAVVAYVGLVLYGRIVRRRRWDYSPVNQVPYSRDV